MTGKEVTLPEILDLREQRAAAQKRLLEAYGKPVVCFTMNIPGPVKQNGLILRGFRLGCRLLRQGLEEAGIPVLHWEAEDPYAGSTAYCAADTDPVTLKRITTRIEDSFPLGRLYDMDVLNPRGSKLDREQVGGKSRDCIVCGAPGRGCASRRLHTVPELQAAAEGLLTGHFLTADAETVASLAEESLLEEVRTTPKPGLVDLRNTGSHRDMNADTFAASAHALRPYFAECVRIGQRTAAAPEETTFGLLRQAGLAAETEMYRATGGVNTHKGAIFTLGILCGAMGRLWNLEGTAAALSRLLELSARIGTGAVGDFALGGDTAGLRLYRGKGIGGIREEVARGLPSVANIGLPVFRGGLARGLSRNDAALMALLNLIAGVEDTNLYHRGGEAGAAFAKKAAAGLLKTGTFPGTARMEELDDAFIARNLSAGGCADLLAVTLFLDRLGQAEMVCLPPDNEEK